MDSVLPAAVDPNALSMPAIVPVLLMEFIRTELLLTEADALVPPSK